MSEQRWHGEVNMPVTCLRTQQAAMTMNGACGARALSPLGHASW